MRWTLRPARRLTAAAGLLAILAGVPAGLWQIVGWPLPRRVPTTRGGWQHVLNSGFPDTAVINLLALALWIVWAAFLYTLWVEWRATRGGTRRRLPRGMLPMQALAALLIAAIATGPIALTAAPSLPMPAVVHIHPGTDSTAVQLPDQPSPRIANLTDAGTGVDRPAAGTAAVSATQVDTGRLPRFAAAGFDGHLRVRVGDQHYTVTVQPGDTLWDIAGGWLRNHARWTEIYHLNAARYDQHGRMKHGDHIEPGWVLVLPPDARPPAGARATPPPAPHTSPDTGSAAPPAAPSAAPSAAPTPTSSGSSVDDGLAPAPTPTAPTAPSGAATATTVPPTSASTGPAPTAPAAAAAGDHRGSQHQNNPGIDLPGGGWVAAPVAAAIAAAAALVWIQRRRRYRPRPVAAGRRDDADLVPLPRTVAALHRARPEPTFEDHMDHLAPEAMEAATVTTASLGLHANLPLRLPDLPALGVGLVGPGAHDAARGILAAVLSAGGPWAPGDEATITTTAADLTTLLGPDAADRHQLDRVHIADTLDDALAHLERHLLRRARLSADRDGTDLTTLHRRPTDQPQPPIMFLAAAPANAPAVATALSAVLAVGSRLAITGVLLGPWPTGATWHVNTDGTTRPDGATDPAGPRLNTLDTTATTDILDTLREARPASNDLPPPPPPPQPAPPTRQAPLRTIPSPSSPTAPPSVEHTHAPATPHPVAATTSGPPANTPTPTPAGPRLALTVLGKPALHLTAGDTRTDLRIRRSDGIQILVHLAVEPDGATSDQLMTALWPETRPRYARGRFHTTISELRQILAEAIGTDAIGRTDERYHLQPAHIDVDVWNLTAAAHRAATTVDPTHHTQALRDVINLYTGPVADGHNWLWLAPYRETIRRHVLDAYTDLADTETDPTAALALIQDAINLDPYNEDIYQRAMRLHATLNNPDGITRTLRTLTQRLTELEIDTSPQTQQVATDLLAKLRARRRNHDHAA